MWSFLRAVFCKALRVGPRLSLLTGSPSATFRTRAAPPSKPWNPIGLEQQDWPDMRRGAGQPFLLTRVRADARDPFCCHRVGGVDGRGWRSACRQGGHFPGNQLIVGYPNRRNLPLVSAKMGSLGLIHLTPGFRTPHPPSQRTRRPAGALRSAKQAMGLRNATLERNPGDPVCHDGGLLH
jgi:hypothetical protein